MKLINRTSNKQSINWFSTSQSHDEVEAVVKNFKDLILAKGTSALDAINKQLGLKKLKAYKVSSKEISSSDQTVSDEMKIAILTADRKSVV